MKKNNLRICITLLWVMIINLSVHSQNKIVECGNMSVTIPQDWTSSISDDEGVLGQKAIMIQDVSVDHIYIIMEMEANSTPEYIMQNSVVNNVTLRPYSEFGDIERIRYQNYDACSVRFIMEFSNKTMNGKAITFCEKGRSYAIIALAYKDASFNNDVIFNSFCLTGKEKTVKPKKSTREQINDLIREFEGNFGSQIGGGVSWDNLELLPNRNYLIFTYGISYLFKEDLEDEIILELKKEMKEPMIEALTQMANTFRVIQQCKDENYIFEIKLVDGHKKEIFSYILTPQDYK